MQTTLSPQNATPLATSAKVVESSKDRSRLVLQPAAAVSPPRPQPVTLLSPEDLRGGVIDKMA